MEKIEMTCACGATFKVEAQLITTAKERMAEWLAAHAGHQALQPSVNVPSVQVWPWSPPVTETITTYAPNICATDTIARC